MQRYMSDFRVVEVQQTFYRIPKPETGERWAELAPEGFEFTLKAWQGITHPASSPTYRRSGIAMQGIRPDVLGLFRMTDEVMEGYARFTEFARTLGARIAIFQTPKSFHETDENAGRAADFLRLAGEDFLCVWEPRGWSEEGVRSVLKEARFIHCTDPFERMPITGDDFYFRLHGSPPGRRMYRYTYTHEDLKYLVHRIGRLSGYCMFNNVSMYDDALRLIDLLRGSVK